MIHICLKTCNVCSTKYVCKTERDPYKYRGSGTEWRKHNKQCGINHTTEILFSSDNIKEIELFCEIYAYTINPYYWKKPEYANLIVEGGGYNQSGDNNPMYGRHHSEKTKKVLSKHRLGKPLSEEHKKKISNNHPRLFGEKNGFYGKHIHQKLKRNE